MITKLFPYSEMTRGLIVRVSVSYLAEQSVPEGGRLFWAYHIRIENEGEMPAQLISRRWVIIDGRGARQLIEGDGVVGEQPLLNPGEAYDYVSGCPLSTPDGSMEGSYQMIGADGSTFEIAIPKFALTAPVEARQAGR